MMSLKIGVSGINAIDNPGPGTGVIRSLREDNDLDIKIIGLSYDAMEPGIYMEGLTDRVYILPYPSNDHRSYLERLKYIKDSYGLDFIFPNFDAELPFYIKYQDEIEKMGD